MLVWKKRFLKAVERWLSCADEKQLCEEFVALLYFRIPILSYLFLWSLLWGNLAEL